MDLNALDIRRLRAFYLVARQGNLRLAAARLNQTIPAISSKLRRLEKDLGVELFERLPNKLILTVTGERFLREVEGLFERAEQVLDSLSTRDVPVGRLSVSMGSDHSWFVGPKISRFVKRFPEVELRLHVYRAADAVQTLHRGELDICIGVFPPLPKTVEQETIVETGLSLVCREGDPLLRWHPPSLSEIARRRLIVLPGHAVTRQLVDRAMATISARPQSLIEVANCQTAASFVAAGVGVAITHSLCMAHTDRENLRWVDLGPQMGKVAFSAVYRKGSAKSPLVLGLLEEVTSGAGG